MARVTQCKGSQNVSLSELFGGSRLNGAICVSRLRSSGAAGCSVFYAARDHASKGELALRHSHIRRRREAGRRPRAEVRRRQVPDMFVRLAERMVARQQRNTVRA
jgi:hypothetical protein